MAGAVEVVADPAAVAPGTRGTCVTEMDGGELVEVPVTVLGELGPATPEGELVLVRLEGPRFRETGIIAGMSGSPVYVGGRLLGALAYGWSFSKEPIGGVTPFVRMASLGEPTSPEAGGRARPTLERLLAASHGGSLGRLVLDWMLPKGEPGGLSRLPLAISAGVPLPEGGWLADSWRRLGWVSGGGAGTTGPLPDGPLVPGRMVAGLLADGDATLAVGGTVTEIRDGAVWAFGHPFLGASTLALPMARARVLAVLPSLASSFKFFTVGEAVGALTVDRAHGVWGRLGDTAATVPLVVHSGDSTYRFRVVDHPVLLPLLASYLTFASHAAHGATFGEQTVSVRVAVHLGDHRDAEVTSQIQGTDAPPQAAAFVAAVLGYINASPFEPPPVTGVEVHLDARPGLEGATLVDAVPQRRVVRPGDELRVRVRLRRHRAGETTQWVALRVPPTTPDGRLDLVVADGAAWTQYDLAKRPSPPASFADELALLGRVLPPNRLVVVLEDADSGLTLPGGSVWTPPSVALTVRTGLAGNVSAVGYRVVNQAIEPMPYPFSGAVRVPLKVRHDGGVADDEGEDGA